MCDFKPGDEVVCVDASGDYFVPLVRGAIYTVSALVPIRANPPPGRSRLCAVLVGVPLSNTGDGWCVRRFRKVQKRKDSLTLESFLTIKPGQFEEPKRPSIPSKTRERT